ncbi:hypothetical protein GCM10022200_05070 [Microbacterium awajiense]|uniref:Uncharacterized protein n=1 Tax=Microbacterium awajiense TaxID=415214 RepID=A0ABP7A649_9MICO
MTAFPRRLHAVAALGAASLLALTACATAGTPGADATLPLGAVWPAPPESDVVAQGMVMDVDGEVELCLGTIAESYPPQCLGIPVDGWSWDGVEGSETSGEVRWGSYAVYGTYDGERFTVTQTPIMLALYDPMRPEDPTGGEPGDGSEADVTALQDELPDRLDAAYLSSFPDNGWLWVDVVWDDGTFQDAADAEFGEGVVVIRSAMNPIDG